MTRRVVQRRSLWAAVAVSCLAAGGLEQARAAAKPDSEKALSVESSVDGFRPATLKLRRGETYRLTLTSADREHCFGVAELRIEKRILPDRETTFVFSPDRVGQFEIYCCVESGEAAEREAGELIVTD